MLSLTKLFNTNKYFIFQLKVCPKHYCLSTVGVRRDLFRRDPDKVPVTDFFGSLRPVELTTNILTVLPVHVNKTIPKHVLIPGSQNSERSSETLSSKSVRKHRNQCSQESLFDLAWTPGSSLIDKCAY